MATNTLSVRRLRDLHPKALAIARAFRRIRGRGGREDPSDKRGLSSGEASE